MTIDFGAFGICWSFSNDLESDSIRAEARLKQNHVKRDGFTASIKDLMSLRRKQKKFEF